MPKPTIKVLGTYALPFDAKMLKQQTNILYGKNLKGPARRYAEEQCREQLGSTVLIEALIQEADKRFRLSDFTQPLAGVQRDNWQAPWAEGVLSVDGESRLETRWSEPPTNKTFRVAFFLHYWKPDVPLLTSYGEVQCPPVQEMPERLQRLVPYQLLE